MLVGVLVCHFVYQMSIRIKTTIKGCSPVMVACMALSGDSLPPCGQLKASAQLAVTVQAAFGWAHAESSMNGHFQVWGPKRSWWTLFVIRVSYWLPSAGTAPNGGSWDLNTRNFCAPKLVVFQVVLQLETRAVSWLFSLAWPLGRPPNFCQSWITFRHGSRHLPVTGN